MSSIIIYYISYISIYKSNKLFCWCASKSCHTPSGVSPVPKRVEKAQTKASQFSRMFCGRAAYQVQSSSLKTKGNAQSFTSKASLPEIR